MIGPVRTINFSVTTRCSRRCPSCCSGVRAGKEGRDQTISSIAATAMILGPVEIISLYGGEPSFHADFVELADRVQEIFEAKQITIQTNGYGFDKFPQAFLHFDLIIVSAYTERTYAGCPSNAAEIEGFRRFLRGRGQEGKLVVNDVVHLPDGPTLDGIPLKDRGRPCYRQEMPTISYFDGLLYPCCTGAGIPGAVGIPVTAAWRKEIVNVPLPCKTCLFSVPA